MPNYNKTTNMGLVLTVNEDMKFQEWRRLMNGEGDGTEENPKSNMQIIDEVLGQIRNELIGVLEADY